MLLPLGYQILVGVPFSEAVLIQLYMGKQDMFKTRCDTLDIQEEACHVFVLTLQWGCVLTSAYCFPSVEQIINITRLLMMDSGINNLVIDGSTRGWVNAGM